MPYFKIIKGVSSAIILGAGALVDTYKISDSEIANNNINSIMSLIKLLKTRKCFLLSMKKGELNISL